MGIDRWHNYIEKFRREIYYENWLDMHDQLYAHLIRSQLEPFAFNKWNTDDGVSMHEISKSISFSSFPLMRREV